MALEAIENMSASELKDQREALVALAAGQPAADLAARYVQARLDARMRDEKLAEQGKTITILQAAHEELSGANAELRLTVDDYKAGLVATRAAHATALASEKARLDEVTSQLATAIRQRDLLRVQADKFASAIGTILQLTTEAVQAQAIAQAASDEG